MNDSRGLDLQGTCYKCGEMGPLEVGLFDRKETQLFSALFWGPLITGYFGARFAGLRGWWFLFCL